MKALIIVVIAELFLSGCAITPTPKDWAATGGSRADGVVRLSYDVGLYEVPKVSEFQAINLSTKRCKAWGYSGAEAFGGVRQQCTQSNQYRCLRWTVTKEYQCTGTGTVSIGTTTGTVESPIAQ